MSLGRGQCYYVPRNSLGGLVDVRVQACPLELLFGRPGRSLLPPAGRSQGQGLLRRRRGQAFGGGLATRRALQSTEEISNRIMQKRERHTEKGDCVTLRVIVCRCHQGAVCYDLLSKKSLMFVLEASVLKCETPARKLPVKLWDTVIFGL